MRLHGEYLVDYYGEEFYGVRDLRKHIAWYFKGYPVGGDLRSGSRWSPPSPNSTVC